MRHASSGRVAGQRRPQSPATERLRRPHATMKPRLASRPALPGACGQGAGRHRGAAAGAGAAGRLLPLGPAARAAQPLRQREDRPPVRDHAPPRRRSSGWRQRDRACSTASSSPIRRGPAIPTWCKAERAEFDIRLLAAARAGEIVLPASGADLAAAGPADGSRTAAAPGRSARTPPTRRSVPNIGAAAGRRRRRRLPRRAPGRRHPCRLQLRHARRGELPLDYRDQGHATSGQPLTAEGRTGNVLQLTATGSAPFPLEINAAAGKTR